MTEPESGRETNPKFGAVEIALLLIALGLSVAATSADYVNVEERMHLMKTQANDDMAVRFIERLHLRNPPSSWLDRQNLLVNKILNHASAVLVVATVGSGVVIFARPSARRKRSVRGAGVIAVAALLPWLSLGVVSEFLLRRFPKDGWQYAGTFRIWSEIAEPIGGGVVAIWLLLAIGRSWRAEPTWRDRLGRALAVAWLVYAGVAEFVEPWTLGE